MIKLRNMLLLVWMVILTIAANAQLHPIIVYNKGISGNNTTDLLKRVEPDVMVLPKSTVIMLVGTNDMINSSKLLSLDSFKINYIRLVTTIKRKHHLVLLTLPPFYEPYLLSRHPAAAYGNKGPTKRLLAANEIIKQIARDSKCPLIDLNLILNTMGGAGTEICSFFSNEANSDKKDGVHPTKMGYSLIAVAIYQYLKGSNLSDKPVICFGDSITYGLGVEGRGTLTGFTYPAILKNLLNYNDIQY